MSSPLGPWLSPLLTSPVIPLPNPLIQGLNNAVALDFDYREQMIYWTDVTTQGSMIRRMHLNGSNVQVRLGRPAPQLTNVGMQSSTPSTPLQRVLSFPPPTYELLSSPPSPTESLRDSTCPLVSLSSKPRGRSRRFLLLFP